MAALLPEGKQSFVNNAGLPLVGGKVYTYDAGTNNPRTTWADAGEAAPNTNPVVLDARGEATIFWRGNYKIILRDASDNLIWTVDNVSGISGTDLAGSGGAGLVGFSYPATYPAGSLGKWLQDLATTSGSALVGYAPGATGSQLRTVEARLRDVVNVKDFGALGNGGDDNTALQRVVTWVNGIANTDGLPVGVIFPPGLYQYSATLAFTRPVYLYGEAATLRYMGTGNGIVLGPTNLTGPNNLQSFYGAFDLTFVGYSTATNILYVGPWVTYPTFERLRFYNAGSASGYAIRCPYNNWSINVHDCIYFAGGVGWTTQTNFFRADGVDPADGVTIDFGNSRLNASNNWVRWGGVAVGGIAYYVSGAKSRITGGGSEGAKIAVLLGGWASFTEINGFYDERLFDDPSQPCTVQIGASGDPNNSTDIKGVKVLNTYVNLHNYGDGFTLPTTCVFFKHFADTCKILDMTIDNIDVFNKKYPLLNFPGTAGGHRIVQGTINVFGPWEAQTYSFLNTMDNPNRARLGRQVRNFVSNPDFRTWTANVTAAAAPLNAAAASGTIQVVSDGTGGSRTVTRQTTPVAGNELQVLDFEPYFLTCSCAAAGSGVTFFTVDFLTAAKYRDVVSQRLVLSFMGRAAVNTNVTATLAFVHGGAATTFAAFDGPVTINSAAWKQYSTYLVVPEIPAGTTVNQGAPVRLLITLPTGTFACDIANMFLHANGMAWPFQVATS